jgi:hypothetical protein
MSTFVLALIERLKQKRGRINENVNLLKTSCDLFMHNPSDTFNQPQLLSLKWLEKEGRTDSKSALSSLIFDDIRYFRSQPR